MALGCLWRHKYNLGERGYVAVHGSGKDLGGYGINQSVLVCYSCGKTKVTTALVLTERYATNISPEALEIFEKLTA